jgi:hypothetical protein
VLVTTHNLALGSDAGRIVKEERGRKAKSAA